METKTQLPYYRESVKKAIYNWRENHKEEFRIYANKKGLENYYNHKDKILEEARNKYATKMYYDINRAFKEFRKIQI
jgi:uncharacterized membrane protein